MTNEQQAIDDERAADKEVREGRPRLVAVLRAGGFPAIAAVFAAQAAGLEEEREYIGGPEPAAEPRVHTMAYSDPGLNLFRPPPMARTEVTEEQVAEALASTGTPVHPAGVTTASDTPPPSSGESAARHVLRQRGIYAPTDQQIRDVLSVSPWLGFIPEEELPRVSLAPLNPEAT